jgi:hypothetical protein
MSNRRITVANWTIPGSADVAEFQVSYPESGLGIAPVYRVHVQPTTLERYPDGVTIRRYFPRAGYQSRIEDAPRFNARKLAALAADPNVRALAVGMYRRVLADRGIDGADTAEPVDAA